MTARCKLWDNGATVVFTCPGCNREHALNVSPASQPAWGFNGNIERPTLSPSILCRYGRNKATSDNHVCHSFVTDGRIAFLPDCTHALAGQTIDLPEVTT